MLEMEENERHSTLKMVVTVSLFVSCLIASLIFQNWLVAVLLFFCAFACAEYLGVRILLKQQSKPLECGACRLFDHENNVRRSRRFSVLCRTYGRSTDLFTTLPLVLALLFETPPIRIQSK